MAIRRYVALCGAMLALEAATAGTVAERSADSSALGEPIRYRVYLPDGYRRDADKRYPVLYLLHGRGDKMTAWANIIPELDRLISESRIPPVIAIMPDATASRRASFYIDSEFTGSGELPPGRAVETAFTRDLVSHVDGSYPTLAHRDARLISGYSMGGYGTVRYALAHPNLFGAAIALSPAVFVPTSPADSSTRTFGAFGRGAQPFDEEIYRARNYPALLDNFERRGLPLFMFIGVGDDEQPVPAPTSPTHDLDYEAHTLYNRIRRIRGITAELRVVNGRHDWDAWKPTFIEGVELAFQYLQRTSAAAPQSKP